MYLGAWKEDWHYRPHWEVSRAIHLINIRTLTVKSGKSSLFLAILGVLPYSGTIVIDGIDISTVPKEELRSRITTLTQDGVELKASVRRNVYPFDLSVSSEMTNDETMTNALQRVGLWDYIAARGGLDASMGDMEVSQGQKQLLFLARAIIRKERTGSKIVLVDEATSSLDLETDRAMQVIMSEAFAGCTIVVISHRPLAIENADVVFNLDSGKIESVVAAGEGGAR